jgi:hypothetical protein
VFLLVYVTQGDPVFVARNAVESLVKGDVQSSMYYGVLTLTPIGVACLVKWLWNGLRRGEKASFVSRCAVSTLSLLLRLFIEGVDRRSAHQFQPYGSLCYVLGCLVSLDP